MAKTLIISHNTISTYNNMGKTFLALFGAFKPSELCQLYIYPSVPDSEICGSYYRVTDKDVLKSFYRFGVKGKEIIPDTNYHLLFANQEDERLYRNKKNKLPFRMLVRDFMWKCSHWYNRELKSWLDREQPDRIFVAPGQASFLYDIALRISKTYKIPIVSYICDDYFFLKRPTNLLGRIHQFILESKIDLLMAKSSHVVTICDELRDIYFHKFKVPASTIMTGTNYSISSNVKISNNPSMITYMGNIRCNRYRSLIKIGYILDEINSERMTNYQLHIYSSETDKEILSSFCEINSIHFCGYVSGVEFERVFHSAEILLHTEAFDEVSIDLVKHSVSTKIADSLASGIPLFAYGPEQVASMKHLARNNCAIIATSKDELKERLLQLFNDANLRTMVASNALAAARKYHDSSYNSKLLYQIINNI